MKIIIQDNGDYVITLEKNEYIYPTELAKGNIYNNPAQRAKLESFLYSKYQGNGNPSCRVVHHQIKGHGIKITINDDGTYEIKVAGNKKIPQGLALKGNINYSKDREQLKLFVNDEIFLENRRELLSKIESYDKISVIYHKDKNQFELQGKVRLLRNIYFDSKANKEISNNAHNVNAIKGKGDEAYMTLIIDAHNPKQMAALDRIVKSNINNINNPQIAQKNIDSIIKGPENTNHSNETTNTIHVKEMVSIQENGSTKNAIDEIKNLLSLDKTPQEKSKKLNETIDGLESIQDVMTVYNELKNQGVINSFGDEPKELVALLKNRVIDIVKNAQNTNNSVSAADLSAAKDLTNTHNNWGGTMWSFVTGNMGKTTTQVILENAVANPNSADNITQLGTQQSVLKNRASLG